MAQKVFVKPVDRTGSGKISGQGITLVFIDTSRFKDAIQYRLQIPPEDPGCYTFHKDTQTDFISHLSAEERRRNSKTGLTQWVKIKKANHYLDATVLAFAAADPEFFGGVRTKRSPSEQRVESPVIMPGRSWVTDW